jgi:large subunit ribosomal protein L9
MQVILFQNIEKLGMQGDIVNVANGYYRNYLGPRGAALEATAGNLKRLEVKRHKLQAEAEKQVQEAEAFSKQLAAAKIHFVMKAHDGDKLFGSVHDHEILEQLVAQGFNLERRQILLREPIKTTGTHTVRVRLVGQVDAFVHVTVEPEEEVKEVKAEKPAPVETAASEDEPEA